MIVGAALMVTVTVALHPPLFVNVITLVPAATPVTNPVELTVATAVVPDAQGVVVAAVPDPVNCVVEPTQTESVPVIAGTAFTVTVAVLMHPPLFLKVITLVPAATPVTRPVLLTVAIVVVPDTQGVVVAAVPEPVSWVADPAQTVNVPVIVGAVGWALITTLADETEVQPEELVTINEYVPAARPAIVALVPVPVVMVPPGVTFNDQVPVEGKLFKTTLPVANAQDGWVIVPTVGVVVVQDDTA